MILRCDAIEAATCQQLYFHNRTPLQENAMHSNCLPSQKHSVTRPLIHDESWGSSVLLEELASVHCFIQSCCHANAIALATKKAMAMGIQTPESLNNDHTTSVVVWNPFYKISSLPSPYVVHVSHLTGHNNRTWHNPQSGLIHQSWCRPSRPTPRFCVRRQNTIMF